MIDLPDIQTPRQLAEALSAIWPRVFLIDLLRYLIGAGAIALLAAILGGRWFARIRKNARVPAARQIMRELLSSFRTVIVFATVGTGVVLGANLGVFHIAADPLDLGWLWLAASTLILIVLHDAWFYWAHRLLHDRRLFRLAHRLHHRSHQPTPWTAYAFDTVEAAVNALFLPVVLLFLPVSPLALFLFTGHMILRNAMAHCGFELFPARRNRRPVFDWITAVPHHDLHHADGRWNFGFYFTFWDRLMGTEHPRYHEAFAEAVSRHRATRTPQAAEWTGIWAGLAMFGALAATLAAALASPYQAKAEQIAASTSALPAVAGVWATEGHGAHVRLGSCPAKDEALCGWMIWSWDPEVARDQSDGPMLWDFERGADGVWRDGRLRHPESGFVFGGEIVVLDDSALKLEGCAGFICDDQVWRRVDAIPGCLAYR